MGEPSERQIVRAGGHLVLPVLLTQGEDGYLVAVCPILPGCISRDPRGKRLWKILLKRLS